VVLGPSGFESELVGEAPASQAAAAVDVARAAAHALLYDLERAAKWSEDWADQSLGFALVQNGMDRCLNRLARTGCWGRVNQMPSNEFWAIAGSWLQLGSLQERARSKPRGYAGDYEMFVQFFEGYCVDHPLGRLFDRYFQSQVAVEAVRSRTQQIAAALAARCLAADGDKPFRIVSVGCGPGLDVELALRWLPAQKRNQAHIALLDLDEDAVEHACSRINGLLSAAQVVGRRDNLYRLATKPKILALLDGADFLVCSGLFDYLPDAAAVSLLRAFWQNLSHRGALLVGNFAPHNPTRAYMEWLGNWYLTYRTRNELLELAEEAGIPPDCISVGAERLGVDLFICADKAI